MARDGEVWAELLKLLPVHPPSEQLEAKLQERETEMKGLEIMRLNSDKATAIRGEESIETKIGDALWGGNLDILFPLSLSCIKCDQM